MTRPFISRALADKALARLEEIMMMEEQKGLATAEKAASDLIRYFQTQEQYQLRDPAAYDRAVRGPVPNKAKDLEALTPEKLRAMQKDAMGGGYPGKKAG